MKRESVVHNQNNPTIFKVNYPAGKISFAGWLASLLKESESDVKSILNNKTALHFLIAWSLFESKCFSGFMRSCDISKYSKAISTQDLFDSEVLIAAASHFHNRYQEEKLLSSLTDRDNNSLSQLKPILSKSFGLLDKREMIFLVVMVIYRFRNNIFHGNKRIQTWLQFTEQIQFCTEVMQLLVSHAENLSPSMNDASAQTS